MKLDEIAYDDKQRMLNALKKKRFRVVKNITNYLGEPAYLVAFKDKGKIKLAKMSKRYMFRYGPDVIATIKPNGTYPWFQSAKYRDSIEAEIINDMRSEQYVDKYPLLDVDELEIEW